MDLMRMMDLEAVVILMRKLIVMVNVMVRPLRIVQAHVVAAQLKDKQVRKLLERDQVAAPAGGKDNLLRAFAKSSFLGRDPFGDKEPPAGMSARHKAVLKDVQDAIYTYARVHAKRVCSTEVWERVREVERAHEQWVATVRQLYPLVCDPCGDAVPSGDL